VAARRRFSFGVAKFRGLQSSADPRWAPRRYPFARPRAEAARAAWDTTGSALAWIVVNPIVGAVTDWLSWRAAQVVPGAIAVAAMLAARAAAPAPSAPGATQLRTLLGERSARRWIGAELIAYGAWTALLTFVGAFFVERLAVREAAVGWLLAIGATAYFAASMHSGAIADLVPRRRLVVGSALVMAVLLNAQLRATGSVTLAVGIFCLIGLAAGLRTPASSGLGLEQLRPDCRGRPG
jgi:predicted MFS family arabinose efflux permease